MCEQLADDITTTVVDGETLAYMLMEMYSRGLNDGATAAMATAAGHDDTGVLH